MAFWTKLFQRDSADETYQKGIKYFNEGDYDLAVKYLEEVMAESRSRASPIAKLGAFYAAEAHAKLGVAEFYRGNHDKALHHFNASKEENPYYPDLFYYLGVVHHQKGDLDQAIQNLEKATELNPEYAEATCFLGIALHDAGYFDRAEEKFSRAVELSRAASNPFSPFLVDSLESKSFDLPVLQELKQVALDNASYEAGAREGALAFNRGDFSQAVECFKSCVALKPDYADLHCKLALACFEKGDYGTAETSFRAALELNPNYTEALYHLGITLYKQGKYNQSKECLCRASEINPEYADIHCCCGVVNMIMGEFEDAHEAFEKSLEISPVYAKAKYFLGVWPSMRSAGARKRPRP